VIGHRAILAELSGVAVRIRTGSTLDRRGMRCLGGP
jgi:hypothetical protein